MRRILCLHGRGAHNDIFRMQLGPIRAALDDYDFEFVQGQVEYQEQHNMLYAKTFNGTKLYTYYNNLDIEETVRTEEELLELALEDGPYDGVIGYSQGAQLASQAIIRFQRENPDATIDEQPFRFAVFFGGPTPNSVLDTDQPLPPLMDVDIEDPEINMFLRMNKDNPMLKSLSVNGTDGMSQLMKLINPKAMPAVASAVGASAWPCLMPSGRRGLTNGKQVMYKLESEHDGQLINKIATLHVRSLADYVDFGEGNYKLCDPKMARQYFHELKHDFPRGHKQMKEISDLIRATAEDPRIA